VHYVTNFAIALVAALNENSGAAPRRSSLPPSIRLNESARRPKAPSKRSDETVPHKPFGW
jgi:hypothetical protein